MAKKTSSPAWRQFEKQIQEVFAKNPKAVVTPDAVVVGRSGRKRKLELLVEYPFEIPFTDEFAAKVKIKIAVDCKDYRKPIGIKKVEEFAGQMDDIGAPVGIMLAPNGFDKGARKRARQLRISLIHTTWDLLLLAKGLGVSPPDFECCQECPTVADEHDSLGIVDFAIPKNRHSPAWGACGFCSAAHVMCPDCFEVTGFADSDEGDAIECAGGCDRVFVVSYDPRSGDRDSWTISGIERRVLETAKKSGGSIPVKKAVAIVAKSKWRLAPKHPQAPIPQLLTKELIELDKTRKKFTLTDEGQETVDEYLAKTRSGYYGW